MNQPIDREKPRSNLYNVIKKLRENSVSSKTSCQLIWFIFITAISICNSMGFITHSSLASWRTKQWSQTLKTMSPNSSPIWVKRKVNSKPNALGTALFTHPMPFTLLKLKTANSLTMYWKQFTSHSVLLHTNKVGCSSRQKMYLNATFMNGTANNWVQVAPRKKSSNSTCSRKSIQSILRCYWSALKCRKFSKRVKVLKPSIAFFKRYHLRICQLKKI